MDKGLELYLAAQDGDVDCVTHLVDVDGVDVNTVVELEDPGLKTNALQTAIYWGRDNVVYFLLKSGVSLQRLPSHYTVLHFATLHEQWRILELLVDAGERDDIRTCHPALRKIYAKRRRCRRAAAATYWLYQGRLPKDLIRLLCKSVWSTRFEKGWEEGLE